MFIGGIYFIFNGFNFILVIVFGVLFIVGLIGGVLVYVWGVVEVDVLFFLLLERFSMIYFIFVLFVFILIGFRGIR